MVTATTTAKQQLADRFERKTAEGLVDVEFYLAGVAEATTDEVYEDVNSLYEAFERGDCRELVFNDPIS
jgi:hypothetical protein